MALQGIDVRDWFRPGSGLTARRLMVHLRSLPFDSPLQVELRAAEEKARKATPDKIRTRAAEWHARNEARRAKEADRG